MQLFQWWRRVLRELHTLKGRRIRHRDELGLLQLLRKKKDTFGDGNRLKGGDYERYAASRGGPGSYSTGLGTCKDVNQVF